MFAQTEKLNSRTKGQFVSFVFDDETTSIQALIVGAPEGYEDVLAKRLLFGLNLFDVTRKYRTGCGYPVRSLRLVIEGNLKVRVIGEFFGHDELWLPRTWDGQGKEYINGIVHEEMSLVPIDELVTESDNGR